jgi:hypothetical protein
MASRRATARIQDGGPSFESSRRMESLQRQLIEMEQQVVTIDVAQHGIRRLIQSMSSVGSCLVVRIAILHMFFVSV